MSTQSHRFFLKKFFYIFPICFEKIFGYRVIFSVNKINQLGFGKWFEIFIFFIPKNFAQNFFRLASIARVFFTTLFISLMEYVFNAHLISLSLPKSKTRSIMY